MHRFFLAGLLPLLVGCPLTTEPEHRLILADIAGYFEDPIVEVTSSGRSVTVEVTTFGTSCNAKGITKIKVEGLTATLEPYNYTPPAGTPCPRDLIDIVHATTVWFDRSGVARILVRGMDVSSRSAANMQGDTITVERRVNIP